MKTIGKIISVFFLTVALMASPAVAATFVIDNSHSTLGFEISHLSVSKTTGEFTDYEGTIDYDPDMPEATKVMVTIKSTSINTRHDGRDNHLRGEDFFSVAEFPTITFRSTGVIAEDDVLMVTGNLTMRGVTKSIEIPLVVSGPVQSPFGSTVIGLSGITTINRQDWGISWNKKLDAGGYLVGDEVELVINVEAGAK